jgi:UDP-glucose 4-epimerase
MNILVTGGAGFIASHVVDAYIKSGHTVTVIDNLSMGRKENVHPNAELVIADIRSDLVKEVFVGGKFDVLNHHAAQMDVRKSVDDPVYDASVNILGTLNLLEQARLTGVKKVIFASTGGAIYGEQDYFPADEEHPLRPVSPYGISKLAIEKYLFYYQKTFGLQHVIFRYANVYGPRQNPHGEAGVVAIFVKKILAGEQPIINGDGTQTRDYVYVKDVVAANLVALEMQKSDILNVGTGVETDVNEIFQLIQSYTPNMCTERHGEAKLGEQLRSVLSWRKINRLNGWHPQMPLKDGIRETVDYFRNLM